MADLGMARLRRLPWPGAPRGVIQLHGAFLFGSCPSRHYAPLLDALQLRGYPSVLHPFPLNPGRFDHWAVAFDLLRSRRAVVDQVRRWHGQEAAEFCEDPRKSCWLGHSLGSKYLLMLEVLSLPAERRRAVLEEALDGDEAERVLAGVESLEAMDSVDNQPTILLAPEVSNTLRVWRSSWQLDFGRSRPSRKAMERLLRLTDDRFGLTGVVAFAGDAIAADDVQLLRAELTRRRVVSLPQQDLPGDHFAPLTLQVEDLADAITAGFDHLRSLLPPDGESGGRSRAAPSGAP